MKIPFDRSFGGSVQVKTGCADGSLAPRVGVTGVAAASAAAVKIAALPSEATKRFRRGAPTVRSIEMRFAHGKGDVGPLSALLALATCGQAASTMLA